MLSFKSFLLEIKLVATIKRGNLHPREKIQAYGDKLKKRMGNVPDEHALHVKYYTSPYTHDVWTTTDPPHKVINKALRTNAITPREKSRIEGIKAAISNSRANQDIIVYRGMPPGLIVNRDAMSKRKTFLHHDPGFMSTSVDPLVATGFAPTDHSDLSKQFIHVSKSGGWRDSVAAGSDTVKVYSPDEKTRRIQSTFYKRSEKVNNYSDRKANEYYGQKGEFAPSPANAGKDAMARLDAIRNRAADLDYRLQLHKQKQLAQYVTGQKTMDPNLNLKTVRYDTHLMKIHVPKGARALHIGNHSEYRNENEVLFHPGVKIHIRSKPKPDHNLQAMVWTGHLVHDGIEHTAYAKDRLRPDLKKEVINPSNSKT